MCIRDREWEAQYLRRQAAIDSLTGLYNRQYAEETVNAMLAEGTRFALCFLDLDGLKTVNDRHGHEEGDRYIPVSYTHLDVYKRQVYFLFGVKTLKEAAA